jgi:hypothetical protein
LAIAEVHTRISRAISASVKGAGLNAYSKGVSLGLFQPTPREVKELAERAYALYERFRREIPPGKKGWRASGLN